MNGAGRTNSQMEEGGNAGRPNHLELLNRLQKDIKGRAKKRAERDAAQRRATAQAGQHEEEDVAEVAAQAQDAAAGALGGQADDPEPASFDESVWQAAALAELELDSLDLDALGIDASQALEAYCLLLEQGGVVESNEATKDTLCMLFNTVVRGTRSMPVQAGEQLLRHYRSLGPVEKPEFVPSLTEFYDALLQLGYRGADEGPAAGARAGGSRARGRASTGVPPSPAPGIAAAAARGSAGTCLQNMRQVLLLLTGVCEVHTAREKGLLDFGRSQQAGGQKLVWALLELGLSRAVCRVAWGELCGALEALLGAWGDDTTWESLVAHVMGRVPKLGPSYRAAVATLRTLPTSSTRGVVLQTAMAGAIMRSLDPGVAGAGPSSSRTRSQAHSGREALDTLRALAGPKPEGGLKRLRAQGGDRPDYWRLITLVECVHEVVWGEVYTRVMDGPEADSALVLAREWHEWCKALLSGLRQATSAAATQLRVLLSEVVNLVDFAVLTQH